MSRHDHMAAGNSALPAPAAESDAGARGVDSLATQAVPRPVEAESLIAAQVQDLLVAGNDHVTCVMLLRKKS